MEMVPFGQKSFLRVDQIARTEGYKRWHKSRRKMVVSDSTIERSLKGFGLEPVRGMLEEVYRKSKEEETLKTRLKSGRKLVVGITDGSGFGKFLGCVLAIAGKINMPLDVELYSKGKELEASREVLSRTWKRLGKGFVNIVVGDGLYITKGNIKQCKEELGCDVLIKTGEERLGIIGDARGLFFGRDADRHDNIERTEGIDYERSVKYKITACGEFEWQDIPYKLKVAHVEEEKLKPKSGEAKAETFWVVTTDESLTGEEMRELAHLRWQIENNVFRRLNGLVNSKRCWTHDSHVRESLLLIWFVGFALFGYYLLEEGLKNLSTKFKGMKNTWTWASEFIFGSLWAIPGG